MCTRLWCLHKGSCRTRLHAAAPGTECAANKVHVEHVVAKLDIQYVTFHKNEFFAFFKLFLKTDFPRKNYFNFRYFSGNKELNMLYLTSQNESLVFEPQFS